MDRFKRFRKAENINFASRFSDNDIQLFLDSLNDYYKNEPYNWSHCFEPLLNGLRASYYENEYENRVLHTDICSPLATDNTWSKLNAVHKAQLKNEGNIIWHQLVETLSPDFILISIARHHLNIIRFKKTTWQEFKRITKDKHGKPRTNPYIISTSKYTLNGKTGFLVFGRAANTPFGLISNQQKKEVGRMLSPLSINRNSL